LNSITEFSTYKSKGKRISLITCYDFWSARIISETEIDAVLVGDSAAMVVHGYSSTVNAEVEMLCYHIASVRRGIGEKLIIADLPFLAHRKGIKNTITVVEKFLKLGANAIKIEGVKDTLNVIKYIVDSGIPVMGHLGFTPQSINSIGGYFVQGKDEFSAAQLIDDAKVLQDAGCFSIVLELMPARLARKITNELDVPTIGIGAGPHTSGQIIVIHDLLGLSKDFNPRFLRKYLKGYDLIKEALNSYDYDVKNNLFPSEKESY
jgi:3-methyl-2-oxobutanoate hydroxymethyltransferase